MIEVINEIGFGNALIFCTIVSVALVFVLSWMIYFFSRAYHAGKRDAK